VLVPRPRAAAVHARDVLGGAGAQPAARLLVRHQVAALDLEPRIEQRLDVGGRDAAAGEQVLHHPADRSARLEPRRLGVDELRVDVEEAERVADAAADRAEDLVRRRLRGEP